MGRRLLVWVVLLGFGGPFAYGVAWLAATAEEPLWGVGLLVAIMGLLGGLDVWGASRAARRNRDARSARLAPRERVPVEQQVRALAKQHDLSIDDEDAARLAARWNDAAHGLLVDPERLRADDRLSDFIATDRPGQVMSDLERLNEEVEDRCIDEELSIRVRSPTGRVACGDCRYTLHGLPESTPCPECGRLNIRPVETVGEYVLFVGGLIPPRRSESEVLRVRAATPGFKTTL